MRVMVTGGAGFIGSHLVRLLIEEIGAEVLNLDKLTYAGNLENLGPVRDHPHHHFVQIDIADGARVSDLMREFSPETVMHLAAESHVDRSIDESGPFIQTNIVGTHRLLEATSRYWSGLDDAGCASFRFHMVSTDEVFGELGDRGHFTEDSPYRPNSPYAAAKASADFFVRAWNRTYGLPVLISHCSNNYGPYQFPEKLIPVTVLAGLGGHKIPVYGRGSQVRDWIHVSDHVRALWLIATQGRVGEHYCVSGGCEKTNLELVETLCSILDDLLPTSPHRPHRGLISFVSDRPGHDFRYATSAEKVRRELGWSPKISIESGLRNTVAWYLANPDWCQQVLQGGGANQRRGLGNAS